MFGSPKLSTKQVLPLTISLTSFWVEPKSSIPLKVEMRLQLNILLRKVEGIEYLFKNLPEVMFPVLWFDSVATLPEHMAGPLNMLVMLPTVMEACGISSVISSFIIIFLIFFCKFRENHRNREIVKQKLGQDKDDSRTIKKVKVNQSYTKVPLSET